MSASASTALASASKLGDLLAQLPLNPPKQWPEIERTAQSLANDLRSKDVEQQTALGQTLLPQTLTSLLKIALNDFQGSEVACKPVIFELLRVAANLCMDHDENRDSLLETGFPQTVLNLLESYAESAELTRPETFTLSLPDLKIVKTAVGFLLNASVGYDPVKDRLVSLEAALTILKLSAYLYPVGSWILSKPSAADAQDYAETWSLRSTLASWSWRAINELRGDDDNQRIIFGQDALPLLVTQLKAFIPPYPTLPPQFATPASRRNLVQADFDVYEQVCGLLESLCLDVEDVRLSLARGLTFPDGEHGGIACLSDLLTFVDKGDYPPYWTPEERSLKEKGFDLGKGAIVKAIVEVAGEEKNTDTLWDDSEADKPGGEFVSQMVGWIRTHKSLKEANRDDLIICATLSLGNICRRDAHSTAIIRPPIALAPDLATLLEPETDIKVKHGVIGLLKHLAQSPGCRAALGEAGIIQRLACSQIWSDRADMVEMIQVAAIGVAKHMCIDFENAFALVLPDEPGSPLRQVIDLVNRSDSIAVKSEGTRVLVNAVRSLWSTDPKYLDQDQAEKREATMTAIVTEPCVTALARLIGRSKRYPTLINEGVVALSLISTHANGGTLVLDSILNPLPSEAVRTTSQPLSAVSVTEGSPVVGPRRALDMLMSTLRQSSTPNIPPEVRSNVCSLFGHLGRKKVVAESRSIDVERMKESIRELVEALAKEDDPLGNPKVAASAKRALEAWA